MNGFRHFCTLIVFIFLAGLIVALPIASREAQKPAALPKASPAAKASAASANAPSSSAPAQLTAADLEAFLDGFIPAQLQREDIAGAVIIIVKDGQILFSHGYGYADVATKKPVSVDDTLFRPGSVSKLFTCTAVMQLVEQGKLDLDRDVNDYLDFKIPATYSQPVTLRRIMTHTAGFEEWDKGLFVSNAASLEKPSVYLPENLPTRIFAPSTLPAYSNYAMSLAGYIVQRVSGERFEDYISDHIYKPLSMVHSTFEQPLPPALAPLMSSGYQLASGKAKGFEFVNSAPAGSMSTPAQDMSHFMIAHLQDGRYENTQILKPETAKLMHSRAFGLVPELNGMALAFFQEDQNGHKIIGHGGDTQYFHSHLHLILDSNVGLFISLNSAGRSDGFDFRDVLWNKFLDRYFPPAPPLPPAVATAAQDAKKVAGHYITSRRGDTNITKIGALLGEMAVSAKPDGTIVTDLFKGPNGQPVEWREIGPLLYRDVNSQLKIAFRRNSKGKLDIFTDIAAFSFQPAPEGEGKPFVLSLLIFSIAIIVLTLVFWPVSAIVRRHYRQSLAFSASERRMRTLVRIVCLFDFAAIIGWFSFFSYVLGDIGRANRHADPVLHLIQIVTWIGAIGTILVIGNAYASWTAQNRWRWSKFFDTIIALGCIAWVWFAVLCNFLHLSAKY